MLRKVSTCIVRTHRRKISRGLIALLAHFLLLSGRPCMLPEQQVAMSPFDPEKLSRRNVLRVPAMAAAYGLLPHPAMAAATMDEADPEGTKIAIKLTVRHTSDEELLFLKQIGLRWLHADFR